MPRSAVLNEPKIAAAVVAWNLDGQSNAAIARGLAELYGITTSDDTVRRFLLKRPDLKQHAQEAAVLQAGAPLIAEKAWRTTQAQQQYNALMEIVASRGFMAREPKWVVTFLQVHPSEDEEGEPKESRTDDEGRTLVPFGQVLQFVEKFDAALSKELRELRREVAEEFGQIPTGKQREGDAGGGLHLYQVTVIQNNIEQPAQEYVEV